MRIRRRPQLRTKPRDFLPVLPAPDVSLDRPLDNSSRIYRVVRIACDPQRLPVGSRVFGNLLGFYTRQIGALGSITQLDDGTTAAVIAINEEPTIDEDAEIVVELEQLEADEPVPPVRRNPFDFTEDQAPVPSEKNVFDFTN